jgi:hypothetical protein
MHVTVRSWNELQNELYRESWNQELGRFRSRYAFRGLSDAGYRLETALIRLGGKFVELEHHLLRNFKKYAHRNIVSGNSVWHWLAVAQHFGLPTRLLDWTQNAAVALFFACCSNAHEDGLVVVLNPLELNQQVDPKLPRILHPERDSSIIQSYFDLGGRINPRGKRTVG